MTKIHRTDNRIGMLILASNHEFILFVCTCLMFLCDHNMGSGGVGGWLTLGLRPPHSYANLAAVVPAPRLERLATAVTRTIHHNYLKTSSISTAPFSQCLYISTSILTSVYKCVDTSLINASREMQPDVTMIS